MPKARVLAPTTDPKTGNPLAVGAEVDLDEESYTALRAAGSVAASEEEQKEHATPEVEGNYGERTGREQAGGGGTATQERQQPQQESPKPPEPPKPPAQEPPKKKP